MQLNLPRGDTAIYAAAFIRCLRMSFPHYFYYIYLLLFILADGSDNRNSHWTFT